MHNCGSWVYEPLLLAGDGFGERLLAGRCVIVDDDGRRAWSDCSATSPRASCG